MREKGVGLFNAGPRRGHDKAVLTSPQVGGIGGIGVSLLSQIKSDCATSEIQPPKNNVK